jgi:glycosyltransferase involved in cell wall biosynthesis
MAHGLEIIVEAARQLREEASIRFVMVGEGAEKPKLIKMAAQYGLKNLDFFPNQPGSFMPHLWAAVDIAVVPLRKLDLFRHTLPAKMFEILAMERPIILAAEGESRELVLEAEAGIVVEPENPTELAQAILKLAGDDRARQRYGRNGRRYVQAHFGREHLVDVLETVLSEVRREAG